MPITSTRISEGIYYHQWQGTVIFNEVQQALETEQAFFKQDKIDKYVSILDGSALKIPPMNINKLAKLHSGDELMRIIYKAPLIARTLGEVASKFANLSVEFYDDLDEALARADELITEYQAHISTD